MAESPILIDHNELAKLLVKQHGIHEGLWGLFIRFGLSAANVPFQPPDGSNMILRPAAIVPLLEIGIQPFPERNDLCVDAAKVNPKPKSTKKGSSKTGSRKRSAR